MLAFTAFCCVVQSHQGKLWSVGYTASLALPMSIMIAFVWFAFVPRRFEYSNSEITLSTLLGTSTYTWDKLYCYGPGNGVFMIKFEGDRQPYQIYGGAYAGWSDFVQFLKTNYPECESTGFYFGTTMRPKGK